MTQLEAEYEINMLWQLPLDEVLRTYQVDTLDEIIALIKEEADDDMECETCPGSVWNDNGFRDELDYWLYKY